MERVVRVKYFVETDTALVEFSKNLPVETREVDENIYVDLDNKGHVVSITIEHAGRSANIEEFLYQRISADAQTS